MSALDELKVLVKQLEEEEGKDPEDEEKKEDIEGGEAGGEEEAEKEDAPKGISANVAQKIMDNFADKVSSALLEAKGGGNEANKKELKSKIFTPQGGLKEIEYPSDLSNLSKDEKIVTFYKALAYSHADPKADMVLRALVEGTTTEGGYLVPEELRAEVFRILPDFAVMRRIARTVPMTSMTLKLNALSARPYAYWTDEYESKSTTSAEFDQKTLTARKLVCLLPISDELMADANINVATLITELFAEAFAIEEDKAFFTGSGTGRPRGINQETLSTINAAGTPDFDDVLDLINTPPQRVRRSPRAAFVGHKNALLIFRKLKDNDGKYIWEQGVQDKVPDRLYGYPVYEQNDLAESELYFGDWGYYIIGDREMMSVKTTQEGGDAWRRDSTEIKAVERVDGRAVITRAFAKMTRIRT